MHSFGSRGFDEVPTLNQGEWILVGFGVSDRVTSDVCTLQNFGVNGGARGVMVRQHKWISKFDEAELRRVSWSISQCQFGAGPGGGITVLRAGVALWGRGLVFMGLDGR